jgi:hypothetical protein
MYPRFTYGGVINGSYIISNFWYSFGFIRSSIVIEEYRVKLTSVPIILAHHESEFFSSSQIILLLLPIKKIEIKEKSNKTVLMSYFHYIKIM